MSITSESSDIRNTQVVSIVQMNRNAFEDKLAANAFFWQNESSNDALTQRSKKLYDEIYGDGSGYVLTAGHVGGNVQFPITISVNFWRRMNAEDKKVVANYRRTDVPLLATYDVCGQWADWTIAEEFVKKLFPNAKQHVDHLNCLPEAFRLIDEKISCNF